MRLLMIGSDRSTVRGERGPFWNTLRGFHGYWDRIDVICPHVPEPKTTEPFPNVRIHSLPPVKALRPLHVYRTGRRVVAASRPDLVVLHTFGLQLMSWGGRALCRKEALPFALEVHHIDGLPATTSALDHLRRLATFRFLRTVADEVEAVRIGNATILPPLLRSLGIPDEKLLLAYAVYLDRRVFRPLADVEKVYDLVFVGRLAHNKGLPLLLDGFRRLRERRPGSRMLVIGRGPLAGWLDRQRQRLPGIDHVPWLGTPQELARAYNSARVVVCTSFMEGGPRVVPEAMACGLPAVSTRVGITPEIVTDGETGFLLEERDPAVLADRALRLLEDPDLYDRCAANAIATAARFDYDDAIREYAEAYLEIARRAGPETRQAGVEREPEPELGRDRR